MAFKRGVDNQMELHQLIKINNKDKALKSCYNNAVLIELFIEMQFFFIKVQGCNLLDAYLFIRFVI